MQPSNRSTIAELTGIRPSLWVAAAVFLGGAGFVIYGAASYDPSPTRADAPWEDRGSRERRRADEPPPTHSFARSGGGYRHHDWGAESELARQLALGLPPRGFWDGPSEQLLSTDPQLAAMWRSFHGTQEPGAETPALPFEPTAHRAELVEAEGDVAQNPESCDVRVLPVAAGGFNCVVRVMCDGAMLYPIPGEDAGYVPCDVENGRPVTALDDAQTDHDGDPLVDLDLARGTVTVEDYGPDGQRRYRATLRIHG